MKTILVVLGFMFFTQISMAARPQMQLVTVNTEKYPDVTYILGLDLDSHGKPVGMFYYDPTKGESAEIHYTFAQLASQPQIITRFVKKDNDQDPGQIFDVIKLGLKDSIVTISYQKDARKNKWTDQTLKLDCDSTQKNCVIRDPETDKTTSALYVPNHTILHHWVTGVDSIEIR